MTETFDADGLLAALQEAMRGGEDGIGLTVIELRQKTAKGDRAVREGLQKLAHNGKLGVSRKRSARIDGTESWVPSYYMK